MLEAVYGSINLSKHSGYRSVIGLWTDKTSVCTLGLSFVALIKHICRLISDYYISVIITFVCSIVVFHRCVWHQARTVRHFLIRVQNAIEQQQRLVAADWSVWYLVLLRRGACVSSVSLPRRLLITVSIITVRSRIFAANSASDSLRFAKFRPQFSESCGTTYRQICEIFSAICFERTLKTSWTSAYKR